MLFGSTFEHLHRWPAMKARRRRMGEHGSGGPVTTVLKTNSHPGGGVQTGRTGEKYQLILDAAISVIAEKGFFQAKIAEIASRAGVADGTVYLYFKNKDQILMAALDSAFAAFLERARAEQHQTSDPRELLRRLARLHLETLGGNRALALVFQTELRHSARFLAQFSHRQLADYFALIRSVVREGQASGAFSGDIPEKIAANCFFGALDEMVTSWVLSEHDYSLPGAADVVVDVILRGLESRDGHGSQ